MCVEREEGEIMCREGKGRGFIVRSVGEMNVCREKKGERICCEECGRDECV